MMNENINLNQLSKELYDAVDNNQDINRIENLLNQGASPLWKNEYGSTVLHWAALNEHLKCLKLFLNSGVNVNEKDNHGRTPLHVAALFGKIESCKLLLNHGADINITNKFGRTPLHEVASELNVECCEFFIKEGLNVNAIDNYGNTPLHHAAIGGNFAYCKFLMEHHANFNIKNKNGEDPLLHGLYDLYLLNDHLKVCKYFFQLGVVLQEMPQSWNDEDDIIEKYELVMLKPDDIKTRYKSLEICWNWWVKQQNSGHELFDIPKEIFERGSEAIDTYFNEIYKSQNRIYRSRICVVGPSGWGKTSLIKSLISSTPTQVPEDSRTIGIDQFQWRFDVANENMALHNSNTTEHNSLDGGGSTERHQVSFWDFAGQDVYKGVHSIFFASSRTIFLICVNLKLYDDDIMNERNNASDDILRWIRLIFAKQPNAKILFIGTKADLVNEYAIETIQEDLSECVKQWCDKYSMDINTRQSLLSENGQVQNNLQQLQVQLSNIKHAVNRKWVISSSQDEHKLREACVEIQCQIRDNNLGFIMPDSYMAVLDYLYQVRQDARSISGEILQLDTIFCSQQNVKGRIRMNVRQATHDSAPSVFDEYEMKDTLLDEILDLFNDLGELLLFNNMKLNRKNGVVIVDPRLMIDLVRDIVRHDLCQYLEHYNEITQLEPSDWKVHLMNGVVCHAILRVLPTWGKLTSGQTLVAQELLHKCQVLHPIGETTFNSKSNVAVPALWLLNQEMTSNIPDMNEEIARCYPDANGIKRMYWEYEFSANTIPESFFELFIVKTYNHASTQTVLQNSFREWVPRTSSLGLITILHSDSCHSIIKIEVASNTEDAALDLLRYYISVIETLLQEYPGVSKTPYYIELKSNGEQIPHVVNKMELTRRLHVHGNEDWLNNNLFRWYLKRPWKELTKQSSFYKTDMLHKYPSEVNETNRLLLRNQLQLLENQQYMKDKLDINTQHLEKLNKSLDAVIQLQYIGEENRQLPALWTAELDHKKTLSQIRVRMLSDISGKCFHIDKPIEIDVPFKILSKYGKKLKYGLNIISLVTPRSIRLDKLDISGIVENAEKIHNLIAGCDLQMYGILNTGTNSQLSPNESRLLLIDLLTLHDSKFTLDQVPRLSGLVCGFITGTGHHIWASEEEFHVLGEKVTIRSVGPLDVNPLLGTMKFSVDLCICQVDGLLSTDQKKVYVKWELVDMNNSLNLTIHEDYTSLYKDASAKPNWKDALWNISFKDFDQLKQFTLRVIVQRSRKLKIYKYREIKELGIGEVALLDILQSYSIAPSNSISINVEALLNQKKACTVTGQLKFPTRSIGDNRSKVVP